MGISGTDKSRVNRRRRPRRRRARGGKGPARVHAQEEEEALVVKEAQVFQEQEAPLAHRSILSCFLVLTTMFSRLH